MPPKNVKNTKPSPETTTLRVIPLPAEVDASICLDASNNVDVEASVAQYRASLTQYGVVRSSDADKIDQLTAAIFAESGADYLLVPQIKRHLINRLADGKVLSPAAEKAIAARVDANLPRLIVSAKGKAGTRLSTAEERTNFDKYGQHTVPTVETPATPAV